MPSEWKKNMQDAHVRLNKAWCDDDAKMMLKQGLKVYRHGSHLGWMVAPINHRSLTYGDTQRAFALVLEGALAGSRLSYKALRLIVKTNIDYRAYKPTVREIFKTYYK